MLCLIILKELWSQFAPSAPGLSPLPTLHVTLLYLGGGSDSEARTIIIIIIIVIHLLLLLIINVIISIIIPRSRSAISTWGARKLSQS